MKSISCVAVFCFVICAIANAMDYPVRDQSVNVSNSGADVIWFGYTPAQKTNNFWEFYYVSNGIQYRVISTDGKSWVLDNFVNAVRSEAIVKKDNIWYMGYHTRDAINVYFNTTQSSDGINFPTGTQRFPSGEDMSFAIINDSFYCYIRPLATHAEPRRRVGLMKSKNFVSWTPIIPILEVDSINYNNPYSADYRKQFYNMVVFRTGAGFFGIVNVYRVGNNGENFYQLPPYDSLEYTVEPQLVFSKDGMNNWLRTNDSNAFIPMNSQKEIFAIPTIDNDSLFLYAIESTRRHVGYDYQYVNGRYFDVWRYTLTKKDLYKWIPPAILSDINNDGYIDLTDIILIFNDAVIFAAGDFATDLNGDNLVDLTDLNIIFNNYY